VVPRNLTMIKEAFFSTPAQASQAAAEQAAKAIRKRLAKMPKAAMVVSGGSTPQACFQQLSNTELPWQQVYIVPSDERCVPPSHAASNEAMIRRELLKHRASAAMFVPMYLEEEAAGDPCETLRQNLAALPTPFACALLGMGTDGHFASLFPDSVAQEQGLEPEGQESCLLVNTSASPHPRITLTLSALLDSEEIYLLFFGEAKRQVYEDAKQDCSRYPVSRLLFQQRTPVTVFWAP